MKSLLAMRAKKPSASTSSRGRKKSAVLDLGHGSSSEDDDAGEEKELMESEQKFFDALLKEHVGKCQKCVVVDPECFCKIGVDGAHHKVTFHQQKGWAQSLVSGHAFRSVSCSGHSRMVRHSRSTA